MNRVITTLTLLIMSATLLSAQEQKPGAFAELTAPHTTVYRNETLPITLSLYFTGVDLGRNIHLANMPGEDKIKMISDFKELPEKEVTRQGSKYKVRSFKANIRVIKPGSVLFKPRLRVSVITTRVGPLGFGRTTYSNPANVNVGTFRLVCTKLPTKGRPDNFSGAIGQFKYGVKVSPVDVAVGDLVTISSKISGKGYTENMLPPKLNISNNFRVYDPKFKTETPAEKHFEQIVIPLSSNAVEIAGVSFSYFDPSVHKYKTISHGPYTMRFHEGRVSRIEDIPEKLKVQIAESQRKRTETTRPLQIAELQSTTTTDREESARLAPSFSAKEMFLVSAGAQVKVLNTYRKWSKIEYNGNRGWVPSSVLSSD